MARSHHMWVVVQPFCPACRTLRQLGLAGNRLTASGLADLLELVAGTLVTLLDISANSGAMSAVSLKALANAVLQVLCVET